MEIIHLTNAFASKWGQAKNTSQPFVFANGNPTFWGAHADYIFGWDQAKFKTATTGCSEDMTGEVSTNCKGLLTVRPL